MNKKIKVADVDIKRVNEIQTAKLSSYIKQHPGCNLLDLALKKHITTLEFLGNNVVCNKCGHVEEKASYAIAQKAMGHQIIFNCDCGNKIRL